MSKFELKVLVEWDDKQLDVDINKSLHIPSIDTLTPSRLSNMMAENPAMIARWSVLANKAWHEYELLKTRFEVWEKGEHKRCREALLLESDKRKRMTERAIEEAVMSDPEYLRRMEILLQAQENAENIRSLARAFGAHGERLVNISSLMKVEINRSSSSVSGNQDRENDNDTDRRSKRQEERENRAFGSDESEDDDET